MERKKMMAFGRQHLRRTFWRFLVNRPSNWNAFMNSIVGVKRRDFDVPVTLHDVETLKAHTLLHNLNNRDRSHSLRHHHNHHRVYANAPRQQSFIRTHSNKKKERKKEKLKREFIFYFLFFTNKKSKPTLWKH